MSNNIAVSTTKSNKRNRTYLAPNRNPVLVALLSAPKDGLTLADVSATVGFPVESPYALLLEKQGLIARRGVVRDGKPGRPAVLWGNTDKGRKRAKRAIA